MEYKQDGDGKIFTDYNNEVVWIAEVTIDNAQGVVDIMNKYRSKCNAMEKELEKCYAEIAKLKQTTPNAVVMHGGKEEEKWRRY